MSICAVDNGGCDDICEEKEDDNGELLVKCSCKPEHEISKKDGTTCVKSNIFLFYIINAY